MIKWFDPRTFRPTWVWEGRGEGERAGGHLYYRAATKRWVLDDVVEPYGPMFSCSAALRTVH